MRKNFLSTLSMLLCLLIYPNPTSSNNSINLLNQKKSVFQLISFSNGLSTATGFSVGKNKEKDASLILTNYHFCSEAIEMSDPIGVTIGPNERGFFFLGIPVLYDKSKDLCLIETEAPSKPLKVKDSCKDSEKVKIIGGPNGVFPIILDSYISTEFISKEEIPFAEIDPDSYITMVSERLFPGHSGSPVISKGGKACAIIFAANFKGYGGYAMSGIEIKKFINSY